MQKDEWTSFDWYAGHMTNGLLRLTEWVLEKSGIHMPTGGRTIDRLRNARRDRRELAELRTLYARLEGYASHFAEKRNSLCERAVDQALREKTTLPPVRAAATHLVHQLFTFDGLFAMPEVNLNRHLSTGELWSLTRTVRRQLELMDSPEKQRYIEESLSLYLSNLLDDQLPRLPHSLKDERAASSVPFYSILRDPKIAVDGVVTNTFRIPEDNGTFSKLGKILERNICLASGIDPDHSPESTSKPLVWPLESKLTNPAELIHTYLAQTPFTDFFNTSYPFSLPPEARFEHAHIVGGSGHGKTQLLQSLIVSDLEPLKAGRRTVVVIDSQGDLIRNILNLAVVGEMAKRVVYIDPGDVQYPPALNLFDFGLERLRNYDLREREVLVNGAIEMYEYIFGALLGAELTQRQGVIFRYIARLMMQVPKATIHTLIDFMVEPERTRPYLKKLDDTTARFFETQFFSNDFNPTRRQILNRLFGVLSTSALDRMFSNECNKVNLYEAMNTGSLILINTDKELLKQNGCEILGRFFIALICQAALERASIDAEERMDTLVYIDEAHDYFDERMEQLFNQARKFRVGLTIAHQNLHQFDQELHHTVMTSTAIKLVGGLSDHDASQFAREMSCNAEFLKSMRKYDASTEFACHVRNSGHGPLRLNISFGQMKGQPQITAAAYRALIDLNRSRYSSTNGEEPPDTPPPLEGPDKPELL